MASPDNRSAATYGQEVSLRRRVAAFLIAVLVNTLLLLMLMFMSPTLPGSKNGQGQLTTFNVNSDNNSKDKSSSKPKAAAKATKQIATAHAAPKAEVPPPIVPPLPTPNTMIILSREDFAQSDISRLPNHSSETASAGGGAGAGSGNDTGIAAGAGPHGEPLYNAEWYREPTDAELRTYLPKTGIPRGAWADVACQTMPRFHVDNCVPLEDSPPGSHLARAIAEAGWQFLVRPPRVGGKTLVGSWVRIHIAFIKEAEDR